MKHIITSKSGSTLILKPMESDDTEALYKYACELEQEDIFISLNPEEPISYNEEVAFVTNQIARVARREVVNLIAWDGDKVVGSTSITKQGKRHAHVGLFGITLLKPYRGLGYGTQMISKIIEMAKTDLQITQVILTCFEVNQPAIALYRKAGFIEYGRLPKAYRYKGEFYDQLLMYCNLTTS